MNLPNKLTIGRVIAVPFFILFYFMSQYWAALVVFCAASLTDMLDGKIARKYGLVTNFGKIMDPLADKILVYSALCLLVGDRIISSWVLIIILAREFTIAGMRTVAASEGRVIAAAMSGKIKTVLQMAAVIFLLIYLALPTPAQLEAVLGVKRGFLGVFTYSMSPTIYIVEKIAYTLLWLAVLMTVYSGIEYVVKNRDVFREKTAEDEPAEQTAETGDPADRAETPEKKDGQK